MTTFDQILTTIHAALQQNAHNLHAIGELLINRDLNGRVRLIALEAVRSNPQAIETLENICVQLAERLGPHAWPVERAILFEDDLQQARNDAPSFTLEDFPQVHVVDRLATEGDWARISDESSGAPRIVFFSIKGGVGRSTALAATAWSLAQAGKRVLIWSHQACLRPCCRRTTDRPSASPTGWSRIWSTMARPSWVKWSASAH